MKQVIVRQFGGPDALDVVDGPTPEPGPGQVRIRLTGIGMNHADLMARRGAYRLASGDPPFTPGLEGGGVIEALGPGVTDRALGQRVVVGPEVPRLGSGPNSAGGTYRSHYLCNASQTWLAPDNLPDDQLGALWLTYLTAWGCLVWKHQIRKGDIVAIPAASSGVGLAAAQIVRRAGATAIGLTTSAGKVARIQALPQNDFHHLVVTHDGPAMRPWHQEIRTLTAGHGIDVFFDPVASGDYLSAEIRCLAQRGSIYVYGLLGTPGVVDVQPLIRKQAAIRGWALNELVAAGSDAFHPGCRHILDGFADGAYRQHVDRTFPLTNVREAHEVMETGRHVGKLVLVP